VCKRFIVFCNSEETFSVFLSVRSYLFIPVCQTMKLGFTLRADQGPLYLIPVQSMEILQLEISLKRCFGVAKAQENEICL